ncbi:DUF3558 family protein [Gordonia sp. PKS22-38]|uniref:DUF3558 family protein n=1 Tax=Gordonia prachuapensis TaxID=3115651 RepID=A0ABU7MYE7_9ACTN|nr:DUF3558 family protein [Gordonia sp. PKS22-38]
MKLLPTAILATLMTLLLSACGDDSSNDAAESTTTAVSGETSNWADAPVESPTDLTSEQICEVLAPEDVAPLAEGEITEPPTPTIERGLPGCKWPVREGYGWLEISVSKPFDVDILLDTTVSGEYPIGDGTMYRHTQEDISLCRSSVQTPETPDGYLLKVAVAGSPSDTTNACEAAIPQTEKVLQALGW